MKKQNKTEKEGRRDELSIERKKDRSQRNKEKKERKEGPRGKNIRGSKI
jgi:hypothetical protein